MNDRDRLAAALREAVRGRDRLTQALARAEADLRQARQEAAAARAARHEDVTTLCASLEAAEQARATLVGDHQEQLRAIREAFEEREVTRAARMLLLETENARLQSALVELSSLRARVHALEGELRSRREVDTSPTRPH